MKEGEEDEEEALLINNFLESYAPKVACVSDTHPSVLRPAAPPV